MTNLLGDLATELGEPYELHLHTLQGEETCACSDYALVADGIAFRFRVTGFGLKAEPVYRIGFSQLPYTLFTSGTDFKKFVVECDGMA